MNCARNYFLLGVCIRCSKSDVIIQGNMYTNNKRAAGQMMTKARVSQLCELEYQKEVENAQKLGIASTVTSRYTKVASVWVDVDRNERKARGELAYNMVQRLAMAQARMPFALPDIPGTP